VDEERLGKVGKERCGCTVGVRDFYWISWVVCTNYAHNVLRYPIIFVASLIFTSDTLTGVYGFLFCFATVHQQSRTLFPFLIN